MVRLFFPQHSYLTISSAELDKYKKAQPKGTARLIPRPAKITKLVNDMRLGDQKQLYNQCRVSVILVFGFLVLIIAAPCQGQDEELWNQVLDVV
jgi:hypothetical protein